MSDITQAGHDAVHRHFGLTYANYLVLPRTLLQSMPGEWQRQFVRLLQQFDEAFAHVAQAEAYEVTAGTEQLLDDMTASQLHAAGIEVTGEDDGSGPASRTCYHRASDGAELDGEAYGFIPAPDPVPHYNRGRTRVPPRLGDDRLDTLLRAARDAIEQEQFGSTKDRLRDVMDKVNDSGCPPS